jgi:hypothetical protein
MKRLAFLALLVVLTGAAPAAAQVPLLLNYQGVLTDNAGNLVADGSYGVTFRICTASTGGVALFTEAHTGVNAVSVVKGGFSVLLGSLSSMTLPFDIPYWLEIEVAGGGGPLTPRVRLTPAPYALMAKTVLNGAISSAKVADNSLVAADQVDEPGVAFLEGETVDNLYSTPISMAGRTITVPAAGYVVAIANATINITHSAGTVDEALISVSTSSGTHNTANQRTVRLSNLFSDGGTYRFGVHVQEVFIVASAGSYNYYIIGSAPSGVVSSPEHSMILLYVPTAYGGISSPEAAPARVKPAAGPDRP